MSLVAVSDAYRLGEEVGTPALLLLLAASLIWAGIVRRRRGSSPTEPTGPAPSATYNSNAGIHPAAYATGGWLEGSAPTAVQRDSSADLPTRPPWVAPPLPPGESLKQPSGRPGRALIIAGLVLFGLGVLAVGQTIVGKMTEGPAHTASLPDRLGQLVRITTPESTARVASRNTANASGTSVTAEYGTSATAEPALVLGLVAASGDPTVSDSVRDFEAGLRNSPIATTPNTMSSGVAVEPGPLGGIAVCWTITSDSRSTIDICAWSVHGLLGTVETLSDDNASTAATMRAVRAEVERVG